MVVNHLLPLVTSDQRLQVDTNTEERLVRIDILISAAVGLQTRSTGLPEE